MKTKIDYFKIITLIFLSFIISAQECGKKNIIPPEIVDSFREYLTKETWYVDRVVQCDSNTVTSSYAGFTIKFDEQPTQGDSIIQMNFVTTNGSPAFYSSGYLNINANEINNNSISSIRDDTVTVIFANNESNIKNKILEFTVVSVVNCNSSFIIKRYLRKIVRLGDVAFRCIRR